MGFNFAINVPATKTFAPKSEGFQLLVNVSFSFSIGVECDSNILTTTSNGGLTESIGSLPDDQRVTESRFWNKQV